MIWGPWLWELAGIRLGDIVSDNISMRLIANLWNNRPKEARGSQGKH